MFSVYACSGFLSEVQMLNHVYTMAKIALSYRVLEMQNIFFFSLKPSSFVQFSP
jgi:hypothetical protein